MFSNCHPGNFINHKLIIGIFLIIFQSVYVRPYHYGKRQQTVCTTNYPPPISAGGSVRPRPCSTWRTSLSLSQITLAVSGLAIVLLSIVSAAGFFGYLGVSCAMIIFQILPFLVLAVGVDNIFIFVQTLQAVTAVNPSLVSQLMSWTLEYTLHRLNS